MSMKITLDTNCIINLLDSDSTTRTSYDDLAYILSLVENNTLQAFVTTRFQTDQSNDKDPSRVARIASELSELPIETIGVGFRLDVSTLEGSDFLGDETTVSLHNELVRILSPSGLKPQAETFSNRINDIDHLIGHYQNNNDVFITDDGDMLKKAETIRKTLGVAIMSPSKFAAHVRNRIGFSLDTNNTAHDEAYVSPQCIGTVDFDYSNNNGVFTIGQGIYAFDTKWSKASDISIHAYNDGRNVDALAIAKNAGNLNDIPDASIYDYSSRSRTVSLGQILLLRNHAGVYAAIRIVDIWDDTRGSSNDQIRFEYVIAPVGVTEFSIGTEINTNQSGRPSMRV